MANRRSNREVEGERVRYHFGMYGVLSAKLTLLIVIVRYCPSVFILRPGQHLHINKGRFHCFRKVLPVSLLKNDCHFNLRRTLLAEVGSNPKHYVARSVAFDWYVLGYGKASFLLCILTFALFYRMYTGFTVNGVHNESVTSLLASLICRENGQISLAIPATSLLQMVLASEERQFASRFGPIDEPCIHADHVSICKGILPALSYVVREESAVAVEAALPDSRQNPQTYPINPWGRYAYLLSLSANQHYNKLT